MTSRAASQALAAYAPVPGSISSLRSARSVEYDVISNVTYRLKSAARQRKSAFPAFVAALHENRRLWSVLAADVLSPGNALPDGLRAGIAGLNGFVQTHSARVLSQQAPVRPLLEINLAILKGLKQSETLE